MFAVELGVVIAVLFLSGYVAWSREWKKNQDKWPHLGIEESNKLIELLRAAPLQGMHFILIHWNKTRDCEDLAAQIHDAAIASGWGASFMPSNRPWPPGLIIAVLGGDQNDTARTLRSAFESIGLSASIAASNDLQPRILLGSRLRG